ncbi:MAG TPA: hypothetical protein VG245_00515 [Candidatus Dormibacteraeota bacterium]|jgi:hypothetical protein|nr:hypothetical protein [Candidatus Dormibacteraeota bacterium]
METKSHQHKLALSRETVRELDDRHLTGVAGEIGPWTPVIHTLPLNNCISVAINPTLTQTLTAICPTDNITGCRCTGQTI